jgi:hypothetical protein
MVDHASKSYKANCLGWEDVISGAHDLLTHRVLESLTAMCNDDNDAVEGEYHLYEEWQSWLLGHPIYTLIRNGVEGHEEDEGSNKENWGGSNKTNGGHEHFLAYH